MLSGGLGAKELFRATSGDTPVAVKVSGVVVCGVTYVDLLFVCFSANIKGLFVSIIVILGFNALG